MTRINTNVQSLRGLRNLNKSSELLNTALTRLSTGLQINTGRDNPAGLIAGETLKLQITSIEQSIKNSNRANNVLATADAALGEISGLLNQVRGLVQEGLNEGALSGEEISANQLQVDAALSAINRIASNTNFAGDKLIDGSKSFTTTATAADAAELDDFQVNQALFGTASSVVVNASVSTAAEQGELRYTAGGLTADTTLELSGSKGSQVLFFDADTTVDDVVTATNAVTDVTGVSAAVSTNATAGTITSSNGTGAVLFTDARTTTGTGIFDETVSIVLADGGTAGSETVTVTTDTSGNSTITVDIDSSTSTAAQIVAAVNADSDAAALVTASVDTAGAVDAETAFAVADGTDGTIAFTSSEYGSDAFVDVNVLSGSFNTLLNDESTAAARDTGTDIGVVINGQAAEGSGLRATLRTASLDVALDFDATNGNAAGTTNALTITGAAALFQIGQDVSAAGQLGIGIDAINTARLGGITGKLYELGTGGGKSLLDVGPNVSGADLVAIIEESLEKVSTLRGRLGALQKNVIDTNISTLGNALENISEARSQITDTDFATETANLTRAQILSQSGIAVLSIANQNPSQVLSLLG